MNKSREQSIILWACIVGLFALLAYTFVHTGALLARYVSPWPVGYAAAFGVELIIAVSAWLVVRGRTNKGFLYFILVSALTVSAFANVAEGYAVRYHEQLGLHNISRIDPIQAVLLVLGTAMISGLVFAVSEVVGGDVKEVVKQTEREQKRKRQGEQGERTREPLPVRGARSPKGLNYREDVFAILANGEKLGPRPMAERVGSSPGTAKKWIDAYHRKQRANGSGQ